MFFYYKYRRIHLNICMNVNRFNTKDIDDIIEEYESEQTFTELEDGTFEMITGNTTDEVITWL